LFCQAGWLSGGACCDARLALSAERGLAGVAGAVLSGQEWLVRGGGVGVTSCTAWTPDDMYKG